MPAYTIRPARLEDAAAIARVHIDSWRTTYAGIVPPDYLARLSYEQRTERWHKILSQNDKRYFAFVAEDEQGWIVGFADGGPIRTDNPENDLSYASELYAIYLFQEVQGHGLGRRLMLALVEKLVEANMTSMLLWVLADNPSRRFYEAMGGQLVKRSQFELGGATLDEVAYGWRNIQSMFHKK